jgi:molybdopterin-guanine dinucleotide biosynthesis protein A
MTENLLGVVLCGGESKRMGSDKGLIRINDSSWAEHVAQKLVALHIPVVISINEQQKSSYNSIFPGVQLVIDNIDIKGPLRGLLSVHEKYPTKDILLMACDLIDMNQQMFTTLIETYKANNAFDYYVYQNDFPEPFCAIYTARGLKAVFRQASLHSLKKFSFQNLLQEGNTFKIQTTDKSSFKNYNTIPGHHQEN